MTFTASAYFLTETGTVSHFTASARFAEYEDALTLANTFPRYVKVKVSPIGGVAGMSHQVYLQVGLDADKVNGGKNETGLKRLAAFLKAAGDLNWVANAGNAYQTQAEFEAAL